ncbi:MAG: rhodanese-like domain-containing protein [Planctomycetota bacterium]|nr:rhodanese-like domain-containing protein [Planctomycetota bacterium]
MRIVRTLRLGFCVVTVGLTSLLACCTPKIPIEVAPAGGPERLVIDIREPTDYAAGHAPGALNIQLTWDQLEDRTLGYVPDVKRPLALRASSQSKAEQGAAILQELGYQDVTLFAPKPESEGETLELMMAEDLHQLIAAGGSSYLIDIRTPPEFETGVIDSAVLVDQDAGPAAVEGLDKDARYLIICEGGWRSSQLASWMRLQGFTDVVNVIDGMAGWRDL